MILLEPDVFWSDFLLGFVALACAFGLRRGRKAQVGVFAALAAATLLGAFYHGLINTTTTLGGEILWSATLVSFAISSGLLLYLALGARARLAIVLIVLAYITWALFGSEKFIWALLLQASAVITYGVILCKNHANNKKAIYYFLAFLVIDIVAVYIQQKKLQFGLSISHNTIFHVIEIPALIALYMSMRALSGKKAARTR